MSNSIPIHFTTRAKKVLKKIGKKDRELYRKKELAISEIIKNPYTGSLKTGDLRDVYCVDITHRKTNYELAYRIEIDKNGEAIIILLFGTEENFYKELKKFLNS